MTKQATASAKAKNLKPVAPANEGSVSKYRNDEAVKTIFGVEGQELAGGLFEDSILSAQGVDEKGGATTIVGFVFELKPKGPIEVMLATHMGMVHVAMARAARRLARTNSTELAESYDKAFNRLARTFTIQMEAFRKHRNGGNQKVTVEHVTVNQGGQAIVGNVSKGEGNNEK